MFSFGRLTGDNEASLGHYQCSPDKLIHPYIILIISGVGFVYNHFQSPPMCIISVQAVLFLTRRRHK